MSGATIRVASPAALADVVGRRGTGEWFAVEQDRVAAFADAGTAMVINYGLDRVRFLQPVVTGSRVRATTELTSAQPTAQGVRAAFTVTVEIEGSERFALVAQTLALYVPEA